MTEEREVMLVAEVDGKKITQDDVMAYIQGMDPQLAQQFKTQEGVQQIIDELVRQELLYLEAKEKNFDEEEEFTRVLDQTKESLLKSYAFSKVIEGVEASDEEIEAFYEENQALFNQPPRARASHILVDDEELAKKIRASAVEGHSFETLAKDYSTCPSKAKGGDLGTFTPGQMVEEFDREVFSMKVGTISEPIKTQFGYHIIKLVERYPGKENALEDVRPQVRSEVLRKKQQEAYQSKVDELADRYEVKLY